MNLKIILDDLERRLDPETEDAIFHEWKTFLDGKWPEPIFAPHRRAKSAPSPDAAHPHILTNDALDDMELMLARELEGVSNTLEKGWGCALNIRCNYGTGILPSLFGAEIFIMEPQTDTQPGNKALPGGIDDFKRIAASGVPSFDLGWGPKVFRTLEFFMKALAPYPKLSKYLHIYHPDLQGPLDICEVLRGSDIFLDFFDNADVITAVEDVIVKTYIGFLEKWDSLYTTQDRSRIGHWRFMHRGRIVLRDDSAMNLSPEMFDQFVKPFDSALLGHFGGGVVHFCGRGDHFIEKLSSIPGLYGVNLGQPQYNDMETVLRNTVDKGIHILGFHYDRAAALRDSGRDLRGLVHC